MRRMSFAMTTDAVLNRSKTVTRRLGWIFAKVGDLYLAVDKIRTKNAKELGVIEVVSVRSERLFDITDDDVAREGFPGKTASWFIGFFNGAADDPMVRRIEFRYVEDSELISHGVSLLERALDEHRSVFNDLSRHQTKKAIAAGEKLAEELSNA
jgi:hypothetical protein